MRTWPGGRRLGGALAALGVLAAGCTDPDATTDAPPARAGSRPGGKVVVGIPAPGSVDPASAADPSGAFVVQTMCDPLIQIDPVTGRLRAAIAKSWEVSDNGRRVTVNLRHGVRFQDGSEVTSDDVVASLSRVASDTTASPLAPLLRNVIGYEQVHGDTPVKDARLRARLRGLRVIERHSLEIMLDDSRADFVQLLGHPLASPMPARLVEREPERLRANPVCAGPYQLAEAWQQGQPVMRLVRSAHYKAVNDGYTAGGRGYADEIELRVLPEDPAAAAAAFRSGELDLVRLPPGEVPDTQFGDAAIRVPGPSVEYVGLPTRLPPFDQHLVRLAFSLALDRRSVVGLAVGAAVPAEGFLPPTLAAVHRPSACSTAPAAGNVAGARALLARAGVDMNGRELSLFFNDELGHRSAMEEVGRQWADAFGLSVRLVGMPWEPYRAQAVSPTSFPGPFRMSWSSPAASADAYLAPLFHSSGIGADNLSRFADPHFDRVLTRVARRATDTDDRRLDYQRLEDLLCAQMPALPLLFRARTHLVQRSHVDSARGPFVDVTTGEPLLRETFVTAP